MWVCQAEAMDASHVVETNIVSPTGGDGDSGSGPTKVRPPSHPCSCPFVACLKHPVPKCFCAVFRCFKWLVGADGWGAQAS